MVKLQIDLTEEEDRIASIYKIENRLETKEQAVKEIIKKKEKCNHKFEVISKDKRVITTIIQRCIYCGIIREDKVFSNGEIKTSFSKK